MLRKQFAMIGFGAVLVAMTALAQDEDYTRFKSDASVQALGSFVKSTTQDGVRQNATDTGSILASYRYYFDRHNGVEASYAWTQNTEKYDLSGVKDNLHQMSAAYVFRMPMKRLSPFVLAGAGAMVFDPKQYVGASTQTRAAFVYGGGADVNLTEHLFVRCEYRGFVYSSPTYDIASFDRLDRVTHRAEPSIGFGWRF